MVAAMLDVGKIEQSLQDEMKSQRIPGAALAIVQNGDVLLARGYGVTSLEAPASVSANTLFRLGSTAKVFTSIAALKLDLHAPIQKYVPNLPPRLARLTLHELLSHTAGLVDDAPQDGPHDESALARNVESWKDDVLFAEPGKVFSYSNLGYVLAGYVLEKAAGKPFASVVDESVLQPRGMATATFRPFVAITRPLALPHSPDGKVIRPFPDHAGAWPPGSLFASANDLAAFLKTGLPAPVGETHATVAALHRQYGYGVVTDSEYGSVRQFHTGARLGYGSRFEIFPEKRFAFFLAGNRTGALFHATAAEIRRQLELKSGPTMRNQKPAPPLAPVQYRNGVLRVRLEPRDGTLHLILNNRTLPVFHRGGDEYAVPGGAQLETFHLLHGGAFLCAEMWCLARVTN